MICNEKWSLERVVRYSQALNAKIQAKGVAAAMAEIDQDEFLQMKRSLDLLVDGEPRCPLAEAR